MEIKKQSRAGTLQSNDCMVRLVPAEGAITVSIQSPVAYEFGEQMEAAVRAELEELGVTGCEVFVEDRGALDCTIRARVKTAVRRAR